MLLAQHCGGPETMRASARILAFLVYIFRRFMRILPAGGANCYCRTRLVQEERCFIRMYRMCIVHPVRTDECNNTYERVVLSDKLLTRITMSCTVHVVSTPHSCIFYRLCDFRDNSHTINDVIYTCVPCSDLLTKIASSKKLINKMMKNKHLFLRVTFSKEIKHRSYKLIVKILNRC